MSSCESLHHSRSARTKAFKKLSSQTPSHNLVCTRIGINVQFLYCQQKLVVRECVLVQNAPLPCALCLLLTWGPSMWNSHMKDIKTANRTGKYFQIKWYTSLLPFCLIIQYRWTLIVFPRERISRFILHRPARTNCFADKNCQNSWIRRQLKMLEVITITPPFKQCVCVIQKDARF